MKKILIACVFLIAFSAQGQGGLVLDNLGIADGSGALLRNKLLEKKKENIEGTPYFNEVFMSSSISGVGTLFVTRYNAFADEVEVQKDDSVFVVPKEEQYNTIYYKLTDSKLKLMRYNVEKDEFKYGYLFELYVKEMFGIYKREKVSFQDERQPANSYSLFVPAKYVRNSPDYYLMMGEDKVIPFPKNKKALISLFSSKEESINAYLKSEKISFKEEADLLKLTKFLATL